MEVISPDDTVYEVEEKTEEWLGAGAQIVWIVNSRRRIVEVHRNGREMRMLRKIDVLDGEEVVPGFTLPVTHNFS